MAISIVSVALTFLFSGSGFAQVSVTTSRNNNNRDGQNNSEVVLTPSNVNASKFGKLFTHYVDGSVYGQPLYVPNVSINGVKHNVIYVVSEHDTVFAFDADDAHGTNSKPLWYTPFSHPPAVVPVASRLVGCADLVPEIGITSTPVIDTAAGTMYVVAKTREGSNIVQRLHALDITDWPGASEFSHPDKATVKGTGSGWNQKRALLTFGPVRAEPTRRAAITKWQPYYITWASHCDIGPYQGWVISYDENTLAQTGVWNAAPNGSDGGIWQSGTGIAADGKNIFLATGNGDFDGITNFGDTAAEAELQNATSPQIKVTDFFTPYNQQMLDNDDEDLGSGGVLLLPDQLKGPVEHLLLVAGKQGSMYLVDRDSMGGYNSTNNNQIVQDLENAVGGVFSTPAFWNNNIYVSGTSDNLRQFTFDPKAGMLSNVSVAQTGTLFKFPGSVPSISRRTAGNTNGIVWALANRCIRSGRIGNSANAPTMPRM